MKRHPTLDDAEGYWYLPLEKDKREARDFLFNLGKCWCLSDQTSTEYGADHVMGMRRANTFESS